MAKRTIQQYGIKYPFTCNSDSGSFVDVNNTIKEKIRGILMHVVFTPKKQKIRDPEFGTDLIKNIFEPNDNTTWDKVQSNVASTLSQYLPRVNVNSIELLKNPDEVHEVFVKISYSTTQNGVTVQDSIATPI